MLFGRKRKAIRRLLIVEDEPLVAFDNEHMLGDMGFEVVATVDTVADALAALARSEVDLVLADLNLSDGGSGTDVARAAQAKGVPVLFVTGGCPADAQALAVGCLTKPYSPRGLREAIGAVEAMLTGETVRRLPPGLTLYERGGEGSV